MCLSLFLSDFPLQLPRERGPGEESNSCSCVVGCNCSGGDGLGRKNKRSISIVRTFMKRTGKLSRLPSFMCYRVVVKGV